MLSSRKAEQGMLAYVFWHQRLNTCPKEEYQEKLRQFHRILQERKPQGFYFSAVLEMAQVPWMAGGSEVYEDWYIVENSAVLDQLDEAAVSGMCREPHNAVARLASNGTGGLYRLKGGALVGEHLAEIRSSTWFNKPAGMSYDRLYELLQASQIDEQRSIKWQRQMTLGPAREFCLHSGQNSYLLAEIESVQVSVQPIFVPI